MNFIILAWIDLSFQKISSDWGQALQKKFVFKQFTLYFWKVLKPVHKHSTNRTHATWLKGKESDSYVLDGQASVLKYSLIALVLILFCLPYLNILSPYLKLHNLWSKYTVVKRTIKIEIGT
jgi:hypothetical protein